MKISNIISFPLIMVLVKKEAYLFFTSPLAFMIGAIFTLLLGINFFYSLSLSPSQTTVSISENVITTLFLNMNFLFLFLSPLLTMKSFSEEFREGTFALLCSSRLTNLEIVLSKFISVILIALFILLLSVIFPLTLLFSGITNWPLLATNYLGTFINILAYLSIGLFCSSLLKNIFISALLSFCAVLFLLLLANLTMVLENPFLKQVITYLSIANHYQQFSIGTISSSDLFYYFSLIVIMLYLTTESLTSRRW